MNWKQKDLICEFTVLREKFDDVLSAQCWHGEDVFIKRRLETKEEMMEYALNYNESRINYEQTTELMLSYLKQFDKLIEDLKVLEIEKSASVQSANSTDNA